MGHVRGVGLQLNPTILALPDGGVDPSLYDFAELLCDQFAAPLDCGYVLDPATRPLLERLRERHPLVAHGNYGNEFGYDPIEETPGVLRHLAIAHDMKSPWYADHLFFGFEASAYMWSSPLQFSKAEIERVAGRAAALQDRLKLPLLHENAFYYAPFPGSDMEEAEFIAGLVDRAQTYLLLDLHNIYSNSINFAGYDVWKFLRTIPLDRVIEIHVAGGQQIEDWYHDFHNHSVPKLVWEMLAYVLEHAPRVEAVTLEVQGPAHSAKSHPVDATWGQMISDDLGGLVRCGTPFAAGMRPRTVRRSRRSMTADARLAYDVWLRLISDEELYRAMLEGSHRQLAANRGLGEAELAVLDTFRAEKGTRWNIENLRFRTALEAGATLASYLPRTVRMLTNGDENWLQDICFEYLAYYRWREYGHHRFAECERFGTYVRERIMKRRITPPHFDVVLDFELGVIRLLKRTAEIPPEQWPAQPSLTDAELADVRLGRARCVELIDLPVDIRDWVTSGDPSRGTVRPVPVTFLVYVPSLTETHRIKILGEGPMEVLGRFDGERTTAAIASELADEFGIEQSELFGLVRNWLDERVLVMVGR